MNEHEVTRREFVCGAVATGIELVLGEPTEPRDGLTVTTDNRRIAVSGFETGASGAQPNKWYYKEMWRTVYPWDEPKAIRVRHRIGEEGLYPIRDINDDPDLAASEANHRAALHQIVEELDRTDLRAVFDVARLLVLIPRDDEVFEWIAAESALKLASAGFDARDGGSDLEALGIADICDVLMRAARAKKRSGQGGS